jgi:hypothetical protein
MKPLVSPHRSDLVAARERRDRLRADVAAQAKACPGCRIHRTRNRKVRREVLRYGQFAIFSFLVIWVGAATFMLAVVGLYALFTPIALVAVLLAIGAIAGGWKLLRRAGRRLERRGLSRSWPAYMGGFLALCGIAPVVILFIAISTIDLGL